MKQRITIEIDYHSACSEADLHQHARRIAEAIKYRAENELIASWNSYVSANWDDQFKVEQLAKINIETDV